MVTGKAYERIADDLRQSIRAGELKPGGKLPAETKLAERYRKGLPTVRQALAQLQAEGLIEKQHGRGNFVRKPRRLVVRTNERHQWEKDRVQASAEERETTGATERDTGLEMGELVFSASYKEAKADDNLAKALRVPVGTQLVERIYRTRHRDDETPFNLVRSYLVHELVASNPDLLDDTKEPWPGGTQSQLHTVGIEVDHIEERITARPPKIEEAEELGISAGVAVMVLQKTSIDTEDRVVDWSEIILPGDCTEAFFTTQLARW